MDISIIILNYKTKNLLKQCIKQIKEMNLGLDYEIIVVDNYSQDGSVEMMQANYPDVRLIVTEKNLGFHKGNNIGIKQAIGKYVLILNTDIIFTADDNLKKMFDYMESNPDIALLGPQLLDPDKTVQRSVMRFHKFYTPFCRRMFIGKTKLGKKELDRFEMNDWDHNSNMDVDWVFGACMLVKKKAIDEVGMMGEYVFLYQGDADWAREFWKHGWRVHYLSNVQVIHLHRRESADVSVFKSLFSPVARIHIKDWLRYLRKWGIGHERPKSSK